MKFPGVKIIDRYIIRKFLGTYVFAIALIIVVVVIFDAAEKIDDFIELKAPLSKIILQYYFNFIPVLYQSVQRAVHVHRRDLLHLEDGLSDRDHRDSVRPASASSG